LDPTQIDQVIMNLAVNARDAMPQGGILRIETANARIVEPHSAHDVDVEPGDYTVLTISDTGVGMDEEVKDHIFEPFFTTKERGKGTGLGLATVFGIIKQNAGHIWFDSQPGQGTTFKIYLPRTRESELLRREAARLSPPDMIRGTETILLVEDDTAVQKLAVEILKAHGYRVLTAKNGAEALRVGEEHKGPIHLLLTDVVMPQMNGRELMARLKPGRPEMLVLYMSGYSDDVIAHHGILEEGIAFLPKPFSVETLTQKVRAVLDAKP
jgi:CheY-like chemotaxis protein